MLLISRRKPRPPAASYIGRLPSVPFFKLSRAKAEFPISSQLKFQRDVFKDQCFREPPDAVAGETGTGAVWGRDSGKERGGLSMSDLRMI